MAATWLPPFLFPAFAASVRRSAPRQLCRPGLPIMFERLKNWSELEAGETKMIANGAKAGKYKAKELG